jgi:uncharacterized cupin superfamily protein
VSDYTFLNLDEVPDAFGGKYPGEMRFLSEPLGNRQVAITHRRMPPGSGGKGSYGHRHKTQEEVYYVIAGTLEFKLGDEVLEVPAGSAVRVAPDTVRSIWNEGPEDSELVIVSTRIDDVRADVDLIEDFWPA